MADKTTFEGDVIVRGNLYAPNQTLPNNSVTDAKVPAGANIDADKLQHRWRAAFSQASGSAAAAETRAIYRAFTNGTILRVVAGSIAIAVGNSTVTIDVKKNGTTILTATIVLDNGNTAYVAEAGTLSVTSLVAGDVLTIVQTVSAGSGTLPQGVFAFVDIDEDAV